MSTKKGIGYSELTERIYLGRQNREKGMWIGDKEDITSDFIQVMFQYVPENNTRTVGSSDGHSNIFLNIKEDVESIQKAIKFLQKKLLNHGREHSKVD